MARMKKKQVKQERKTVKQADLTALETDDYVSTADWSKVKKNLAVEKIPEKKKRGRKKSKDDLLKGHELAKAQRRERPDRCWQIFEVLDKKNTVLVTFTEYGLEAAEALVELMKHGSKKKFKIVEKLY